MATIDKILTDNPDFEARVWKGYQHFTDQTVVDFNVLGFPSRNCSIPSFDKIIPDLGKTLLGHQFTENSGINGNKQKFKNLGGIEMEIRNWRSLVFIGMRDVIEVLYKNDWLQITETVNPLPLGVHEFYYDEWFDTNLDPSQSKRLPRAIWVNGYRNPSTGEGEVYSWTGGIADIVSTTATDLVIAAGITWRSLGFTEDASGNAYVVVKGVSHQLATPSDLDTNSINITSTVGIAAGDTATSRIEVDIVPMPMDMCRQNKGYMFYGNWDQRDYFMSNAFNRPSTMFITGSESFPDDMVIAKGAVYTGTGSHVYRVTIDSVTPPIDINDQIFVGNTGANGSYFGTAVYSGGTGKHVYRIAIISDSVLTLFAGGGTFNDGEGLVCTNGGVVTATLKVISGGNLAGGALLTQTITGTVSPGDTVTGTSSGTVRTCLAFSFFNGAQFFKDNIQILGLPGMFNDGTVNGIIQMALPQTFNLIDGLTFVNSQIGGNTSGDYYELTIQKDPGAADTFKWDVDDGAPVATGVSITGGVQTLQDGVQIRFISDQGHRLGDYWTIQVDQAITRAWVNFYFTTPIRKVGEGYKFRLPSNFWTMDTQEDSMYINGSYGEWSVVTTEISSDLQSESVNMTPLKQSGANKVLYPYLTAHINDQLVYVTVDKNLDTLGRLPFLEKPQTGYLSDPVKKDFDASSFIGGSIKYLNKKLYISSPDDGIMHCYDTYKQYWQPPKSFPEVARLSIVGNDLVCHSNTRNQTYTMFTNDSGDDSGDVTMSYGVEMRTMFTSVPTKTDDRRWSSKYSSMSFIEGYIKGSPPLVHTAYLEPGGCGGIFKHDVFPILCVNPGTAPFGQGEFGGHAFGSDGAIEGDYFREIWKGYSPILQFYFIQIGMKCITKSHTYSILSLGMNEKDAPTGNNAFVNPNNLAQNNP